MEATIYNSKGEKVGSQELAANIFGLPVKPKLIQQVLVSQQANARQVVANTKDRSQVAGGGRKPWKQKGTGRARHGSIRSPLWRGGGVTFGPTNDRNFVQKINRKVRKQAILMCLSDKAAGERLVFLDELTMAEIKTKSLFTILQNLGLRTKPAKATTNAAGAEKTADPKKKRSAKVKSVLLILPKSNDVVQKSGRNIERLQTISANSLNVADLLKYQYLILPVAAITEIEKTFVR